MNKKHLLLLLGLFVIATTRADIRLPLLFSDNMVLQRDRPVNIWGWAAPGEKVTVLLARQYKSVKADKEGQWKIVLDPEMAGGPYQLIVKGKNTRTLSNVMIGEVWICSGQSNMEMPIEGWGKVNDYQKEIAAANYPEIRHFKVPNTIAFNPRPDIQGGSWQVCSPATAGNFSATAYFFARELARQLHVAIGLINTSWGGTMVETWTSRAAFMNSPDFRDMITGFPDEAGMKELEKSRRELQRKKILGLQGSLPAAGEEETWKNEGYDDSRWRSMKVPGNWEQAGLGLETLDGVVWFRKVVIVSEADAGKQALLKLGAIDDSDDSYVNGVKVGSTRNKWNESRVYTIPAGVLKAGRNIIAVRVEDTGGGGGFTGKPEELSCAIGDKEVPLAGDWSFRVASIFEGNATVGPNSAPTLLFNAMINPLIPYTIRGAIWYQGEANAGRAYEYRKSFPLMIKDWRTRWNEGDFPFYFVQLSSWKANEGNSARGSSWAELREAQLLTLALPNTGMAVTTDIGNHDDIHPKDKQDVGARLAAIALSGTYGIKAEYSGPVYQSMSRDNNRIILTFTHTGTGLKAHDPYGYLKGFEIAGADRQFRPARASIEGGKVIVWQDGVNDPVAVRYGWADDASEGNLFNTEGFPASPFRTDGWPAFTEKEKYSVSLP